MLMRTPRETRATPVMTECVVEVWGESVLGGGELAEEEAEAADGETDSHETEAGADPGEEGALGGEVDAGILFG
jgi:hypothetical protein